MKQFAKIVSGLAFLGTILPAALLAMGLLELGVVKIGMMVAAAAWFAAMPVWMEHGTE
ncbi:hypothetical protein HQ520_12305 [bacterium]|nr:hypothetical protein [bacterium]